ncbi:MAG: hypothetical protein KVP17_002823 [Porospora cf. gigantea B]|nr:MAG: hypothetical protein KVP17_002823 [Porospora cf. gigantea B]
MLLPELQVSIEEELRLRHADLLADRERAVGIVGRLRPATVEGVTAVYKQQCEDFHVHEIDLDGNVLHLSAVTVKSEVKREIREQKEIDVGRDMLDLETEFLISAEVRESLRQAFSDADIDCLQRFVELLRHTHRHNQQLVDRTYEECRPESEALLKKGVISYLVEIVPDRARKLEAEVSADFSSFISYSKPPSLFLEGDSGVVRASCSPDANVRKLTRTRMHALIREHFPFLTSDVFEIAEAQKLQAESGMTSEVGANDFVFPDHDDTERALSRFFWPGSSLEASVTKTWVDQLGDAALLFRVQPKPICVSQVFPHLVLRKLLDGGSLVEPSEVKEKRLNSHKERWPKDRPPYLQFRLWKMNRDTAEAIQGVADACHINKKQFSWAGTKDRRGITVQNVRAYKTSAEHLKRATVAPSWDNNVFVSDFEYVEEPLRLGALQGNHFKVCLRNVEGSGLAEAVESLQSRGFINFFGLQRFGTHRVGTHHVGASLLREDWQAAVRLIMGDLSLLGASTDEIATPVESPSPSAGDVELCICEDTEGSCLSVEQLEEASRKRPSEPMNRPAKRLKASEIYLQQNDSVAAAQACPRYFHVEHAVLTHLAKEPKGFLPALLQMPRNSLALYIHAAQAVVWNMVASQRMALHGTEVRAGDLTLPKMQEEQFKQVHVITAEEVGAFTIEDVVLPVVGTMVEYPAYLNSTYDEACQLRLGLSLEQFMRL